MPYKLHAEVDKFQLTPPRPSFPYPLRNQHLDEGSNFEWRCNAIGVPLPTYTWFKNGVKLRTDDSKNIKVSGNLMTIQGVGSQHEGMYQCEAKNTIGMARSSAQLRSLCDSVQGAEGGDVTIACEPQAAPRASIRWEKNGAEVGDVLPNGALRLTKLTIQSSGTYTCVATNALGEARSSCNLNVQGKLTKLF
ncbi:hypothetical protein EGW08_009429, partial [Elysia chlorotica]